MLKSYEQKYGFIGTYYLLSSLNLFLDTQIQKITSTTSDKLETVADIAAGYYPIIRHYYASIVQACYSKRKESQCDDERVSSMKSENVVSGSNTFTRELVKEMVAMKDKEKSKKALERFKKYVEDLQETIKKIDDEKNKTKLRKIKDELEGLLNGSTEVTAE